MFRLCALAISTIVYTVELASAPFGVSLNSQFLRPKVKGRMEFSDRLLEKLQLKRSRKRSIFKDCSNVLGHLPGSNSTG